MIDYPMPDRMGEYNALADLEAMRQECANQDGLAETKEFAVWMEQAAAIYAHNAETAKRLAALAREASGYAANKGPVAPWIPFHDPSETSAHRQSMVENPGHFDHLASTSAGRTALREMLATSIERLQTEHVWAEIAWAAWVARMAEKALKSEEKQ